MADFETAFERTMKFEDNPRHPGEVTPEPNGCRARFGINEKFHPELLEDFWTGPAEEAREIAKEIEQAQYWIPLGLDQVEDQTAAWKIFDMGVNMSVHEAGVLTQRSVNALLGCGLAEDGKIGPKTLAAINSAQPDALHQKLCEWSEWYYRHICANNPNLASYLNAYLARAAA